MRSLVRFFAIMICLGLGPAAHAQSSRAKATPAAKPAVPKIVTTPTPRAKTETSPSSAEATSAAARPQFRPAVLAQGAGSLINLIDAKALLAKGQKDGAVQFAASIGPAGETGDVLTYNALAGSSALEAEVLERLHQCKFTPPIYEHQPARALLCGTVIFAANENPHVRIFLNQDPEEIKNGNDFIAPQPVIGGDSHFTGLSLPEGLPVAVDGLVNLELHVDASGTLRGLSILNENPPLLGFEDAAVKDLSEAKFIPAFRDGDASDSSSVITLCYKPADSGPERLSPDLAPDAQGTLDLQGSNIDLSATPTPPPQ
ncbi:MAG: energy transducer TonB [Verrucomicrobiota bacterium]|nr:energy transducer TonB [Verrucomicrobiota bacterium]